MNKKMHMITFLLMSLGALNWGLVALINFNLVTVFFGSWPNIVQLVYVLIGVSAIYEFVTHKERCKLCSEKK